MQSASPMAIEDLLHPYLGRYLEAPAWLRASAGRAYSWLPSSVRLGKAYGKFRGEIEMHGTAEEHARLAERKLGETLSWALATVPAYRAHRGLLRSGMDPRAILERLPVTDKLDIKRHAERYLSTGMPEAARLATYTGGSTRTPMQFALQKHVTRPREYAFIQDFRNRVGARPGELMLALRGRTVPSAALPAGAIWMMEPIKRHLILSSDHLERRYMPAYAEALARHRPAYVEAFPSALFPLARWLAANPLPEFTRAVKGVMLYSENVYGYQMEKFRSVFGCPILTHYGHSERVLMAGSMPDDERYFFWPQYGFLELLDSQDRPITQPGKLGFVVGTSFDNRVMPFLRYRTGDLAVLAESGHPMLPGYPAVERIAGRLQEFVVCRGERLVSITTLGVAHFPELALAEAIQYEQSRPGEVVLKVVADGALRPEQLARIAAAVERKTQGGCDVCAVQVERIERTPRGKTRMLVQHLDIRRYFGAATQA
jgi:phenylacetate-coenzyme A ligase PaaK-like adenylate-forming protein